MKVLGVSGSLRRDSYNSALLVEAAELLPAGAELERYEDLKEIPPFDEDDELEPGPAGVARFRAALAGSDAVLFATPEYNSSIPGVLKNALDWASRPIATNVLRNKPVAVIGASTGAFGTVFAQEDLRRVLAAIGARVLGDVLPVPHAARRLEADGHLLDPQLAERVEDTFAALLDAAAKHSLIAA
jgi:chromate reductase, NAD(P)H dehydrogenase (quinone)